MVNRQLLSPGCKAEAFEIHFIQMEAPPEPDRGQQQISIRAKAALGATGKRQR